MPDRQFNLTYFSPKTEKRTSPIQGRGLFAKGDIEKDEVVVVKGGYVLTKPQRDEIGKELGPSEIQITEHLFVGPTREKEREGGMMHLNHSCEPNLGLQGQIVFVALRDIKANEELTVDYAMIDDEDDEMQCKCGTKSCRGVITGTDWIKPMVYSTKDRGSEEIDQPLDARTPKKISGSRNFLRFALS